MLNQIRYQQQYQQLQSSTMATSSIAIYTTRNPITGQRSIQTADGGEQIAQYLSNSIPNQVMALSQTSTIGLPGYASQKPH